MKPVQRCFKVLADFVGIQLHFLQVIDHQAFPLLLTIVQVPDSFTISHLNWSVVTIKNLNDLVPFKKPFATRCKKS